MAAAPVSPVSPTRAEHGPSGLQGNLAKVRHTYSCTVTGDGGHCHANAQTGIHGKEAASEQVTNDAFVRGDLTPLSTKVPGLVREVKWRLPASAQRGCAAFDWKMRTTKRSFPKLRLPWRRRKPPL